MKMLAPKHRTLYTDFFLAPDGFSFQEAIGTTFSLGLDVVLELPAYLSLQSEKVRNDPIGMLEAMYEQSHSIDVYYQHGRITPPQENSDLLTFAEEMTIPVTAPRKGVFHPKLWVIVFQSEITDEMQCRLVVLSRNLTKATDWDISLQLDGLVNGKPNQDMSALSTLIRRLPGLAKKGLRKDQRSRANRISKMLATVQWSLPEGFKRIEVFVHGLNQSLWNPPPANDVLIVSPFCSDHALDWLTATSSGESTLISNGYTLAKLKESTLEFFNKRYTLSEYFDDVSDDEHADQRRAGSLHAKIFVYDRTYFHTHIVLGSANATHFALGDKRSKSRPHTNIQNVEFIIDLEGYSKQIGTVRQMVEDEEFLSYLVPFDIEDQGEIDKEKMEAENQLDAIRDQFVDAGLTIRCEPTEEKDIYHLTFEGGLPDIKHIKDCCVRLVTVKKEKSLETLPRKGDEFSLGEYSTTQLSQYLAIRLVSNHPDVSLHFVIQAKFENPPGDRIESTIGLIISDEKAFYRYLRWFLASVGILEQSGASKGEGKDEPGASWLTAETPLLETMLRTGAHNPERLRDLRNFINELRKAEKIRDQNIIPESFHRLWSVVEKALKE